MAKQPVFPVLKLGGVAPVIRLAVLMVAGGLWCLLVRVHSAHSNPGIPRWLLGILLLVSAAYLAISVAKTIIVRRNNPETRDWKNPSA